MSSPSLGNHRLAWKLAAVAVMMSGIGLLAVPLYQSVCRSTGLSGAAPHIDYSAALAHKPDTARWVTVELVTNTDANLPWEFRPETVSLRVHPGEVVTTRFRARNHGRAAIVGQAVPSVTPGRAAPYFYNVDGLCETRQSLGPGEARDMPLQFLVDARLPSSVGTLTLSVAFFAARGDVNVIDRAPVVMPLSMPL